MFGRNKGVSGFASDALETVSPYTDRLAHDEKLRERLVAALTAGVAARNRAQRQAGLIGLARRLATDPILRAQLAEAAHQLQKAQGRVRKGRSHKARNTVLFVTSVGMVVAAVPSLRAFVLDKVRGTDDWITDSQTTQNPSAPTDTPVASGDANSALGRAARPPANRPAEQQGASVARASLTHRARSARSERQVSASRRRSRSTVARDHGRRIRHARLAGAVDQQHVGRVLGLLGVPGLHNAGCSPARPAAARSSSR